MCTGGRSMGYLCGVRGCPHATRSAHVLGPLRVLARLPRRRVPLRVACANHQIRSGYAHRRAFSARSVAGSVVSDPTARESARTSSLSATTCSSCSAGVCAGAVCASMGPRAAASGSGTPMAGRTARARGRERSTWRRRCWARCRSWGSWGQGDSGVRATRARELVDAVLRVGAPESADAVLRAT
jgi:hypothetical protein